MMAVQAGANSSIAVYLNHDGTIAVVPYEGFAHLYEHNPDGVSGLFDREGFILFDKGDEVGNKYNYGQGYPYKQMPVLKAWLVQQQLQLPQEPIDPSILNEL